MTMCAWTFENSKTETKFTIQRVQNENMQIIKCCGGRGGHMTINFFFLTNYILCTCT